MINTGYKRVNSELEDFFRQCQSGAGRGDLPASEISLGKINLTKFSDGELYCQILENVRGKDVFMIQPTCSPVNR